MFRITQTGYYYDTSRKFANRTIPLTLLRVYKAPAFDTTYSFRARWVGSGPTVYPISSFYSDGYVRVWPLEDDADEG